MSLTRVIPTRPEPVGTLVPDWVGSRWTPGHVIRRDSERGTYEELNSLHETLAESLVQRALLSGPKTRGWMYRLFFGNWLWK